MHEKRLYFELVATQAPNTILCSKRRHLFDLGMVWLVQICEIVLVYINDAYEMFNFCFPVG